MDRHSLQQVLSTPAVLCLSLLSLFPWPGTPIAEAGPTAARSATPYYDTANDETTAVPAFVRRGLAVSEAGVEGGTDVTLSPTNGPNEPAVAVHPRNPSNII